MYLQLEKIEDLIFNQQSEISLFFLKGVNVFLHNLNLSSKSLVKWMDYIDLIDSAKSVVLQSVESVVI